MCHVETVLPASWSNGELLREICDVGEMQTAGQSERVTMMGQVVGVASVGSMALARRDSDPLRLVCENTEQLSPSSAIRTTHVSLYY